jgi:hypothetical protein
MSTHNLELLVEAARLLKPLLGELVLVGGSTTALLITDKAPKRSVPATMWMVLPKSPHTQHTQSFRSDSVNKVSLKILARELRFAGGVRKGRFWMYAAGSISREIHVC